MYIIIQKKKNYQLVHEVIIINYIQHCINIIMVRKGEGITSKSKYNACSVTTCALLPYSRKLSREKTFTNFAVLEPPAKVFSTKFGRAIPTYDRL